MREIKFRAWCNIEQKLYEKFYVEDHLRYAFMHELIESARERYVFMQYTGIDDKNETNIYEGDIVRLNGCEPYSNNNFTTDYDWEFTGEVKYLYGAFWIDEKGMMISLTDYFNSDDMEALVVGNIFGTRLGKDH